MGPWRPVVQQRWYHHNPHGLQLWLSHSTPRHNKVPRIPPVSHLISQSSSSYAGYSQNAPHLARDRVEGDSAESSTITKHSGRKHTHSPFQRPQLPSLMSLFDEEMYPTRQIFRLSPLEIKSKDDEDEIVNKLDANLLEREMMVKAQRKRLDVSHFTSLLQTIKSHATWSSAFQHLQHDLLLHFPSSSLSKDSMPQSAGHLLFLFSFTLIRSRQDALFALETFAERLNQMAEADPSLVIVGIRTLVQAVTRFPHLASLLVDLLLDVSDAFSKHQGLRLSEEEKFDPFIQVYHYLWKRADIEANEFEAARLMETARVTLSSKQYERLLFYFFSVDVQQGSSAEWIGPAYRVYRTARLLTSEMVAQMITQLETHHAHSLQLASALTGAIGVTTWRCDLDISSNLLAKLTNLHRVRVKDDSATYFNPDFFRLLSELGMHGEAWSYVGRNVDSLWSEYAELQGRQMPPSQGYERYELVWHYVIQEMARDPSVRPLSLLQEIGLIDGIEDGHALGKSIFAKLPPLPSSLLLKRSFLSALMMNIGVNRSSGRSSHVVLMIWNEALKRGVQIDRAMLQSLFMVLFHHGKGDIAMQQAQLWTTSPLDRSRVPEDVHPTIEAILPDNQLMLSILVALRRDGSFLAAYKMFNHMRLSFGVDRDVKALSQLLLSARSSVIDLLSNGNSLIRRRCSNAAGRTSAQLREEVIWDGQQAYLVARRIFMDAVLNDYSELKELPNALEAAEAQSKARSSWTGFLGGEMKLRRIETWTGMAWRNLTRFEFATQAASNEGEEVHDKDTLVETRPIALNNHIFHQYLTLLRIIPSSPFGQVSSFSTSSVSFFRSMDESDEIAWDEPFKILSWMRALGIVPLRETLCLISIYLDQILPPLANPSSATGPLHPWLAEWLGEDNLPTQEEVGAYMRWIRKETEKLYN